jgi:hypothetical protein
MYDLCGDKFNCVVHYFRHDFDSTRFNPALPPINDFYFGNRTLAEAIAACGEPHATRYWTFVVETVRHQFQWEKV